MILVNSRLGRFTAALRRPAGARSEDRSCWVRGRSFFRSYGARLPSSLARVLSRTLAFYARLPVSVCSTGTVGLTRGFSWPPVTPVRFLRRFHSSRLRDSSGGFTYRTPSAQNAHNQSRADTPGDVTPSCLGRPTVAPECRPAVHRLRLSASA